MVSIATKLFDSILYGSVPPYRGERSAVESAIAEIAPQPIRTSWVFDSHVQEAQGGPRGGKTPQSISLAWDQNEGYGIDASMRSWQGYTIRERKEILLSMYIANPWVSACCDVIAKRITSGGLVFEPLVDKPNKAHLAQLEDFCLTVNDEWDFLQYVRASIVDELIFGECFTEIVWAGKLPSMLYKVDCLTMSYRLDKYGRVVTYIQQLDHTNEPNLLDPKNIIRWWFPHPGAAMSPFSPMERITDAVNLDKKMVNFVTTFFQKGAKFPYYIQGGPNFDLTEAERYKTFFENNYTGEKNAHMPPITYGDTKLVPTGKGSIDIDFPHGRDRNRTEVLTAYHVPPAIVGIIESGNIGGGTGEDQEKSFQYNTCDPVRHTFFEKFNYRIVQKGFNIHDYRVTTRYADYRTDESVAKVQDMRIRNGSVTINETREEMGKKAYTDGGSTAIVVASRDIVPVPRLDALEDEQTQSAQLDIETKKTQLEKAKEPPPEPVINNGQQPSQQNGKQPTKPTQGTDQKSGKGQAKEGLAHCPGPIQEVSGDPYSGFCEGCQQFYIDNLRGHVRKSGSVLNPFQTGDTHNPFQNLLSKQEDDTNRPEILQHHTGMMLAFMLDAETANKLALPGGEPASQLHLTLAYMGDMEEEPPDGKLSPHTSPERLIKMLHDLFSVVEPPLTGYVGGIARFINPDEDTTPIVATVNIPGLQMWRNFIVNRVEHSDYYVAKDHDFTPHITLAYISKDASMPIESIPNVPLSFDTVCLAIGDERYFFRMGEGLQSKQETAEDYNPQNDVWEPPDIDQQLAALIEQGYTSVTWVADNYACDICIKNDNVTVKLDETFPSGHRLAPGHPNCRCITVPVREEVEN